MAEPPKFGGPLEDAAPPHPDELLRKSRQRRAEPKPPASCPTCGQALPEGNPIPATDTAIGDVLRVPQPDDRCVVTSSQPMTCDGAPAQCVKVMWRNGEPGELWLVPDSTVWRVG